MSASQRKPQHHLLKNGENLTVTVKQELKLLSIFLKYGE
jgi:hypothetical protein